MNKPMQSPDIKKYLLIHKPKIKISTNNIRDIMKLFHKKGIVSKVYIKKKSHPRYVLTKTGEQFKQLLMRSELPFRVQ